MKFGYYQKAKEMLEKVPASRLVENRPRAIWALIKKHQNPNLESLDREMFIKYWHMFQSFDRAIRDVQEDCPELTSEANEEKKEILRQEKILELGYQIH